MAADAVRRALTAAGLELTDVDQAYAAYVYGDSTSGQRGLYHVDKTGMPIVNVNNTCSSAVDALSEKFDLKAQARSRVQDAKTTAAHTGHDAKGLAATQIQAAPTRVERAVAQAKDAVTDEQGRVNFVNARIAAVGVSAGGDDRDVEQAAAINRPAAEPAHLHRAPDTDDTEKPTRHRRSLCRRGATSPAARALGPCQRYCSSR
ncbi:hypothetical protein CLV47_10179 [Antricoccus suffuscus]|uniref:Uncharacterized protein n=1 Tax=Antricoccus suffuscus TaxID=1629062 RepID=A0A2T1A5R6_9ACTN|nr:hypothetical protein [Antricoccus suffuscus]PRZ43955.1 hypothetical protein CLV47_10179 [Antricoccus suffuscus]